MIRIYSIKKNRTIPRTIAQRYIISRWSMPHRLDLAAWIGAFSVMAMTVKK